MAEPDGSLSFPKKVAGGLISGALGSFIANPFDLSLVRLQADAKLPLEQRRNYKNVFDAVIRVSKGACNGYSIVLSHFPNF